MKKILALCAGVTVLMGVGFISTTSVAHAQASGPFADVPTDHWAYGAVDTLQKAGIVIGYPDGTYGGKRAMTRYEFAEAIARLLPLIPKPTDTSDLATKSDLSALQADIANKLQQNQDAIDALKALVNEFQGELTQLGQDVAAIKARLSALEARVAAVEEEQRRFRVTGDVNFIARSNIADGSKNGAGVRTLPLDKDGYRIGNPTSDSVFDNPNVYHDVLLTLQGKVSEDAQAVIKIDAGNYIPSIVSQTSLDPANLAGNATAPTDTFNIYEAYLDAPVSLGPFGGAEAYIGRFGTQFTPYTFKAIDPDSYTNLPETDSGDVIGDGGKLVVGSGGINGTFFAEKNAPIQNSVLSGGPNIIANNGPFRPGSATSLGGGAGGETYPINPIDESAGARLTLGTPDTFTVGLSGVVARTTANVAPGVNGQIDPQTGNLYNNLTVYSADINGLLPFFEKTGITLNGEYAVAATGYGSRVDNDDKTKGNEAWYAELGYTFGPFAIKGGYQEVYANFAAPGYWGKIGDWTNPNNIRGGIVSASYAIDQNLSLVADGNFYKGINNVYSDTGNLQSPIGHDDSVNRFDVGLKAGLTSAYSVDLGYEYVQWDVHTSDNPILRDSGKPTEEYVTIGLGHPLNRNASVKLLYQIISYSDKNTGFDPAGSSRGGVALTQFALKF